MRKSDYIVIILLIIFGWGAEYIFLLAPEGVKIHPFIFTDQVYRFQWFIWMINNFARLIIYVSIILLSQKKKLHWVTIDVVIISLIITIFEFIWFLIWYDDPFKISVGCIKLLAVIIIFGIIYSIRKLNGTRINRTDNSSSNGNDILRRD